MGSLSITHLLFDLILNLLFEFVAVNEENGNFLHVLLTDFRFGSKFTRQTTMD